MKQIHKRNESVINMAENTFHPIVFTDHPLPGEYDVNKPIRLKSKMHHTGGFQTREEAIVNINISLLPNVQENFIGEPVLDLDTELSWDGDGIPAISCLFANGKLI